MLKKIFTVLVFIGVSVGITAIIVGIVMSNTVLKPDPKAEFVNKVRDNVSMATRWTDDQLVDVAKASCDALKSGSTIREITYLIATNSEVESDEVTPISSVIGYGISAYCPELGDKKMKEYSGLNN